MTTTADLAPLPVAPGVDAAAPRNFSINFGPQHPAAHGVLRLVLELDGEIVERVDPHIGLLHRGTEKLMEARTYLQNIPYFDRLDYCAPMNQEHAFCLGIEKLLGTEVPRRGQLLRVMFCEIGRILSHLLNLTTQALDVGALTPPLWGFEEREKLMVFYERASGARLHANYFRVGGVHIDCPVKLIEDIGAWCDPFLKVCDDLQSLFLDNRIFKQRNVDIGIVSLADCWNWGFSGPVLRASGVAWDLRKAQPYDCYEEMDFDIPVGTHGDSYGRQVVRMEEMRQSVRIMKQCVEKLLAPGGAGASPGAQQQAHAAEARRDEALDGSAHPSLQALHRRLPRAGRRGLCRRRGAEGRVRRLSRVGRHRQAVPLQDPGARFRASVGDGFPLPQVDAGRRQRDPRLARHRVRRGGPMTRAMLTMSLILAIVPAAHAAATCQDYTKLKDLPASFNTISRSAIGPAKMEIKTDGTCTCNDLPAVQRSLGQAEPDGINFACDAADPSDTGSK